MFLEWGLTSRVYTYILSVVMSKGISEASTDFSSLAGTKSPTVLDGT